jgi:hypothetical protein
MSLLKHGDGPVVSKVSGYFLISWISTTQYLLSHSVRRELRDHIPRCDNQISQDAKLLGLPLQLTFGTTFLVPLTNCFVHRWFCVALGPEPPLHPHSWLSFGKFQDTERFLTPCPQHASSRLSPSCETWKYAMAPIAQTNLERFSTFWYATFCYVCVGYCTAEFGNSGGT